MTTLGRLFLVGVVLFTFLVPTTSAKAPIGYVPKLLETKEEMVSYATTKALLEGVDVATVLYVISCESQWNPSARGDSGYSRGLAQIHSRYHPDVSDAEADNPQFAVDFLVEGIANNQGKLWTCYRNRPV